MINVRERYFSNRKKVMKIEQNRLIGGTDQYSN